MAGRGTHIPKGSVPHRRSGIHRGFSYIAHNRRNIRFKGLRRVHTPPQPLTAHTAAHTPKHGAFSPPETSAGSIGSTAWVPCVSSLSARRSSISRFPLLRRTTAEIPILLSAATLCRIRRDTFFGVMPSLPAGSIFSNSTLAGALISGCRRSNSERRMTIRPPSSSGCVRLSDTSSHTFSALRSSVSSRYSMSRPMQESFALPLPRLSAFTRCSADLNQKIFHSKCNKSSFPCIT